jgi:Sap-like sulfolipid-1-addressing protein
MLAEAAGLAVLAAISPTALLVAVVYLGSARPRETLLCYLVGAVLMSAVMGVVVLVVLRAGGFSLPSRHTVRYELRLFLGLLLVLAGLVLVRYKREPPDPDHPQSGLVSRLVASPAPYTAFLAGLLIFAPGITFIAAVQVVATAQAGLELTATALTLIVVINVALVWLPLLGYLAAPGPTTRRLVAFNAWLRRNGRLVLAGALVAAGLFVAIDGLAGLLGIH